MTSQTGHFEDDKKGSEKRTLEGWVTNDLSSSFANAIEHEIVDPVKNFAHDIEWLASGGKSKPAAAAQEKKRKEPDDLISKATDFAVHGTAGALTYSMAGLLTQAVSKKFGAAFNVGGTALKVLENRTFGNVVGAGIHDFYLNADDMKGRLANAGSGATAMLAFDGANHFLPAKCKFTKIAAQPLIGAGSAAGAYYVGTLLQGTQVNEKDLLRVSAEGAAFGAVFPIASKAFGKLANKFEPNTEAKVTGAAETRKGYLSGKVSAEVFIPAEGKSISQLNFRDASLKNTEFANLNNVGLKLKRFLSNPTGDGKVTVPKSIEPTTRSASKGPYLKANGEGRMPEPRKVEPRRPEPRANGEASEPRKVEPRRPEPRANGEASESRKVEPRRPEPRANGEASEPRKVEPRRPEPRANGEASEPRKVEPRRPEPRANGEASEPRKVEPRRPEPRANGEASELRRVEPKEVKHKTETNSADIKPSETKEAQVPSVESKIADGKDVAVQATGSKIADGKDVAVQATGSKIADGKDVAVQATESKIADGKDVAVQATESKIADGKDVAVQAAEPKIADGKDVAVQAAEPKIADAKDVAVQAAEPKIADAKDVAVQAAEPKIADAKDVAVQAAETRVTEATGTESSTVGKLEIFESQFGKVATGSESGLASQASSKYGMPLSSVGVQGKFTPYALPFNAAGGSIVAAHSAIQNLDEVSTSLSSYEVKLSEKFQKQLPDWMNELGFRVALYSPSSQGTEGIAPLVHPAFRKSRFAQTEQQTTFTRIVAPSFSQAIKTNEISYGIKGPNTGMAGVLGGFESAMQTQYEELIGKMPELQGGKHMIGNADIRRAAMFGRYPFLSQEGRRQSALLYSVENSETANVGMVGSGGSVSNNDPSTTDPTALSVSALQAMTAVNQQSTT
jgi:hypothetical protein